MTTTTTVGDDHGAPLLVDAGGTNIRLARLRDGRPGAVSVVAARDYAGLAEALTAYLNGARPTAACIAVAGPADGGEAEFQFTNLPWTTKWKELAARFGWTRLTVMNDFAALALGALELAPDEWLAVGDATAGTNETDGMNGRGGVGGMGGMGGPMVVIGPGTGMGVAGVVDGRAVSCEGGHIAFAPGTAAEREIARLAAAELGGRVSVERLLSGPGLERMHRLHARAAGREAPARSAAEILELGLSGADAHCREALRIFAGALGAFAGDAALMFGARGGCLVGGGIGRRLAAMLAAPDGEFRRRFNDKGRLAEYVRAIPLRIMTAEFAAMRGVARRMRETL